MPDIEDPTDFGTFTDTDASGELDRLVEFLDYVDTLPGFASLRERSHALLSAHPGDAVVDVGCGMGARVAELANHGCNAIGVDLSEQIVQVARLSHPELDLRVASAQSLPFVDSDPMFTASAQRPQLHSLSASARASRQQHLGNSI